MFVIGKDELDALNMVVKKGDKLMHQHSDGTWEEVTLEYGKTKGTWLWDENRWEYPEEVETDAIGFYTTKNGSTYMASIKGKLLARPTLKFSPASNSQ